MYAEISLALLIINAAKENIEMTDDDIDENLLDKHPTIVSKASVYNKTKSFDSNINGVDDNPEIVFQLEFDDKDK